MGKKQKGISLGKEMPFDSDRTKWLPFKNLAGNYASLERPIKPVYLVLPDPKRASLGAKLRYLRKRRRLTILDIEKQTGVSHNAISRIEYGVGKTDMALLGKLVKFFGADLREILMVAADHLNQIVEPKDFGSWLKNFRLRHGLRQVEIATKMGLTRATICRYENNIVLPNSENLNQLRKQFGFKDEIDRFL